MNEEQPQQTESAQARERQAPEAEGAELQRQNAPEVDGHDRPRIYAASLSDYNNGILHGAWLDAAVEPTELYDGIAAMLAASPTAAKYGQPAEEWAVHDFEGFGPLRLGEYEDVSWITDVAKGIAEHGLAFAAWASQVESDPERLNQFDDAYHGEWESAQEYAESLLDDHDARHILEQLPDWLQPYVELDVAGFARDLEYGGDITVLETPDGGVWVFGL